MAAGKIDTGFLTSLVTDYRSKISENLKTVDIVTFAEAAWGLNFNLFPMQKFILKTFYGLPLDDSVKIKLPDETNTKAIGYFTEKGMQDYLYSTKKTNHSSDDILKSFRELVLCCGRRASKSSMLSIICAYEVYRLVKMGNPQKYYGFPSGQEIAVTIVASVEEQAATMFDMIKNRIKDCSFLNERISSDTQGAFILKTDDDIRSGRRGSIFINCVGAKSNSARGKNNLLVIIDEAAFFNQSGISSLPEVYQALAPSITTFKPVEGGPNEGKLLMISSPLTKSGMFYEKCQEAFESPEDTLIYKLPSAMINPNMDASFLISEQRRNKESFKCEYGGEFSDSISSWLTPESVQGACTNIQGCKAGNRGILYYMGIDFGTKNDGAAVSIVHKDGEAVVLDYADVYYSASSDVWDSPLALYNDSNRKFAEEDFIPPSGFADEILKLCEVFNIVDGTFDQFNGYGLLELLKERGLTQFHIANASATFNMRACQLCKSLLETGFVKLFNHPVLLPELTNLELKTNGAKQVVEAPQRAGFHDDLSDSFILAVWTAHNFKGISKNNLVLNIEHDSVLHTPTFYKRAYMNKYKQHGTSPRDMLLNGKTSDRFC